jgi:diguanylate cyclase (GGDEF)-like protein/PAS domain S-box-containing protein
MSSRRSHGVGAIFWRSILVRGAPLVVHAASDQIWSATGAFVALVGQEDQVLAANPALCAALGLDEPDLLGHEAAALVVPRDLPDFRHALREARSGLPIAHQHEMPTIPEQGRHWVAWAMSTTCGSPPAVACIGVDVTAMHNEFEVHRSRAETDELTGLPNRTALLAQLLGMTGTGALVVFCDLNGFKAVNDTHGHGAGDAVLVQIARRLQRTIRGEDFVCRIGGDEFVIVAPPDPNSDPETFAQRIMRVTHQPIILSGGVVASVGMSIGMAVLEKGEDAVTVLGAADRNMYLMKSTHGTRTTTVS